MLVRRSKAFLFFLSFFFLRVNKNTLDDELEEEFNNRNLKEKRDGFRENDNSPTTIIDGSRDPSCRVYYLVPIGGGWPLYIFHDGSIGKTQKTKRTADAAGFQRQIPTRHPQVSRGNITF